MKTLRLVAFCVALAGVTQLVDSRPAQASAHLSQAWRTATAAELGRVIPARAAVEQERIETEASSMTGIIDTHKRAIAAVVLITAGYAANGKYSHYFVSQAAMRIGDSIVLGPGAYVLGWTRAPEGLSVKLYDAETGKPRGTALATPMLEKAQVVPIKIWAPTASHGNIQIGRFMLPYTVTN